MFYTKTHKGETTGYYEPEAILHYRLIFNIINKTFYNGKCKLGGIIFAVIQDCEDIAGAWYNISDKSIILLPSKSHEAALQIYGHELAHLFLYQTQKYKTHGYKFKALNPRIQELVLNIYEQVIK